MSYDGAPDGRHYWLTPPELYAQLDAQYLIGARVSADVFTVIDQAAVIRGWPRSKVVELGALKEAQAILEAASRAYATLRRTMRTTKARHAAQVRHAKGKA